MPLLNQRITELTENTAPAADDYIPHVDRSDTTMAISGTTKFTTLANLWKVIQTFVFAEDAGSTDTYAATLSPAPAAYEEGVRYRFKANTANTGACTINFNSLGAKAIKKAAGGITTDLDTNDIRAGQWVDLVYDGTNMQMQSLLGNAPAGGVGGIGDVVGPGSATDDAVARFDDTTGKLIQNSVVTISDAGAVRGPTQIEDSNGNEVVKYGSTASAVNEVTITNKATGTGPTIEATGGDTNINLNLVPKGTGALQYNGTEIGFRRIPQRFSSTNTTTVAADDGGHLYHPTTDDNPRTFTIDSNANVAYPVGTAITFVNDQNTLTIAITDDTLVWAEDGSTGSRTLAENGIATALKVTSTRWIISGVGLS